MTSYDRARSSKQQLQHHGEHEDAEDTILSCGEAAALCTHASLAEKRFSNSSGNSSREESRRSSPAPVVAMAPISSASQVSSDGDGVGTVHMPLLTTQEKDGPIGQAFGYLVGMFQALSQQLEDSRRQKEGGITQVRQVVSRHQQYEPQHVSHHPLSLSQYPPPTQPTTVVEQAAATAASMQESVDPSIREIAASVPHAIIPAQPAHAGGHQVQAVARAPQGGYILQEQTQQYAYGAPVASHSNHQSYPSHEIPTISHHQQPRGQMAFAPRSQLPSRATHQPGPWNAPAPAMHHPSAPQQQSTASAPHAHTNITNHAPPTPADPEGSAHSSPTFDDNNEQQHMVAGTGRTLQAQKESTMMKQEMQGQLAFQNKIRALKQIELSKYGGKGSSSSKSHDHAEDVKAPSVAAAPNGADHHTSEHNNNSPLQNLLSDDPENELFWNQDDDQIFDFLMDH